MLLARPGETRLHLERGEIPEKEGDAREAREEGNGRGRQEEKNRVVEKTDGALAARDAARSARPEDAMAYKASEKAKEQKRGKGEKSKRKAQTNRLTLPLRRLPTPLLWCAQSEHRLLRCTYTACRRKTVALAQICRPWSPSDHQSPLEEPWKKTRIFPRCLFLDGFSPACPCCQDAQREAKRNWTFQTSVAQITLRACIPKFSFSCLESVFPSGKGGRKDSRRPGKQSRLTMNSRVFVSRLRNLPRVGWCLACPHFTVK